MSKETVKSVLGIVTKVLTWIVIVATVAMMIFTIFSTLTFDRNDRDLFGVRFYIVLTDSMSPSENNKNDKITFNAGDIVLIKNVKDPTALKDGDVIAFISQNSVSFGKTVTHKIREVRTNDEGRVLGYVTYGSNTGENDEALVEPAYVLGKYSGKLPKLGLFFSFLKTTTGYIVCILVPFLLLILWQGVNTVRLFKKYKHEQNAEIEAERAEIAKEREESAMMMRELMALREQLAQQAQSTSEAKPPENETTLAQSTETAENISESSDDGKDS